MTEERFIQLCNSQQYPLREFIDRTVGYMRHYREYTDLAMRWPPYTPDELELMEYGRPLPTFFDVSDVTVPADRVAFHSVQSLGAAIGHTAGLARVDFG